jgi:GntR family transcriptional regulator, transcriptional repressor for pyruvate dehydrogenase complex
MSVHNQRRPRAVALPGISPVATGRRSDDVAEQIRNLIISERLAEGARLPAERDLAARFGASRPTVSQALRSLSLMGLVEVRHGSGAYVVRRPEAMVTASVNLMLDLDRDSAGHLMSLRLWLEEVGAAEACTLVGTGAGAAAAATGNGTGAGTAGGPGADPGMAAIFAALGRLRDALGTTSELVAADTVFHAAVVRAAGNPYLAAIYESVHGAVLSYQLRSWVDTDSAPLWLRHGGPEQQWALHEPIAAAVLAGDGPAAKEAVRRHHEAMLAHLRAAEPGGHSDG